MLNFFDENKNLTQFVVISIGLAALIMISIASFILKEVVEQHDEEMVKVIASDVYDDINAKLGLAVTVSRVMANDTLLIENLKASEYFSETTETEIMRDYLTSIRNHFDCSAAFLVSTLSQNYYTTNGLQKKLDLHGDNHDKWYRRFLDKNVDYEFHIDTDEAKHLALTVFVNARILDEDKNLLGICGVGIGMDELQQILVEDENEYEVEITLVDRDRLIQVDTDSSKIERSILKNIVLENSTDEFIVSRSKNGFTVTRYIPYFDWYLVVQRHSANARGTLSDLVMYMFVGFLIFLLILLSFLQIRLDRAQKKLEETAKKHGIASHAAMYVSMHLIDLKSNSIYELSRDRDVDLFDIRDGKNANVRILQAVKKMTRKENLREMVDFMNFATLSNRMQNNPAIHHEFLSEQYGWCKAHFMRAEDAQIVFAIEIIDEEKRREDHLRYLSETDAMTGLKNRGSGEKTITDLMSQGKGGMFCLLDADKFKSINDNFGHDVGDKVIKAIADCLKRSFRDGDVTLRLGGDEFAAYAVGVSNEEIGMVVINRLFGLIDQIEIPELGNRKISVSLGASFYKIEEDCAFEDLYKRADSATYVSKKTDGSCATFYHK